MHDDLALTTLEPGPKALYGMVARVAQRLEGPRGRAVAAELRRWRPGGVPGAAFWQIVHAVLPHVIGNARMETAWAIVMQNMSMLSGLHAPKVSLGHALAKVGASESRLLALLRAQGERSVAVQLRACSHLLRSRSQPVDQADFATLLGLEFTSRERARMKIARGFYTSIKTDQGE